MDEVKPVGTKNLKLKSARAAKDLSQQELAELGEDRKAVAHNVREHKAHDAERCQIDDPAHDGGSIETDNQCY